MAGSQFKLRTVVLVSLGTIFLFMSSFYLMMDLVLSKLALEKSYKTETITYQKPNGETGRLRVLTSHNTDYEELRTSSLDLTVKDEDDHQDSAATTVTKEVVIESIKQFLQDDQTGTNSLKNWDAWLSNSTKDGSAKELLRNVILELRELRQANKSEAISESDQLEDSPMEYSGEVVDEDSAEVGEFKFRAYGRLNLRRLVVYSSYRDSLTEFSVITLTPNLLAFAGGPVHNVCIWLQDGSTTSPGHFSSLESATSTGRLHDQSGILTTFEYVNDTHGRNYDTLVIRCSFPQPVGTDGSGGFLYLNMSHSVEPAYSELIPVFHERPGHMNATLFNLTTFQFEYVYCSAPIWTNLSAVHVKQWFMYHHTLLNGNVRYFFYDNIGIDSETMAVLQPFIDAGILTVINQHRERDYDAWYHTQAPTINDCMRRARFLAKWVLFWDFDEYLYVEPPLTLPVLLEDAERKGAPWITFGNMLFSRVYCAPESGRGDDWAVERMLYRLEKPQCPMEEIVNVCPGPMGHRKWIANPRLTLVGAIHYVIEPMFGGVNVDTNIARINHYRGLAAPDAMETNCFIIKHPLDVNDTKVDGWWLKDEELSSFATGSLKVPSQSFSIFQNLPG
ncbi:hypothetical protein R1flu_020846 [Riccia fluitans]|uniref:Glycosyltransferase family 92 protein n=1 Tax=Riccia fluitans TaxID=41844 RepID=A0ABD1ZMN8_9MARC